MKTLVKKEEEEVREDAESCEPETSDALNNSRPVEVLLESMNC